MGKFFEKNLTIVLLAITGYFLFSVSNSLKESAKYHSEIRACAKMKASNNKESFNIYQQQAAVISGLEIGLIGEYCKKLTQQNLF